MVYKKIADNIPSLSSLLLAGVVFGASRCPNDSAPTKEEAKATVTPPGGSTGSVSVPRTEEDTGKFRDIFKELISCAQVDHLKHAPMVKEKKDFEGPQAKANVEALYKSFGTSPAYPPNNKAFTALGNTDIFTFKSGVSGITGGNLKSKAAYGEAAGEIAKVYKGLHELYGKMVKAANEGARVPEIGQLLTEGDTFYQDNIKKEGLFVGNRAFQSGHKEIKVLSGGQMARFMRNTKPERARDIMAKPIGGVWVKMKLAVDACNAPAVAGVPTTALLRRGSTIDDTWKVNREKGTTMPAIAPIDNTGVGGYFNFATGAYVAGGAPAPVCGKDAAKESVALNFGQLLFALFTGAQEGCIFSLESDGTTDVKFITKDKPFQDLVAAAKGGENTFASYLGRHIEKLASAGGSDDLFVVPDVGALKGALVTSGMQSLSLGACFANVAGTDETIGNGSMLDSLCKNIRDTYGLDAACVASAAAVAPVATGADLVAVARAVNLEDQLSNIACAAAEAGANLTFEQRVYAEIAKNLRVAGGVRSMAYDHSNNEKSAVNLCNYVNNFIDDKADSAIVKKEGSGYKPTRTTKRLLAEFNTFVDKLRAKQNDVAITYDQINKDSKNIFDIRKVRDAMEADYNAIKSVLTSATHIDTILAMKEEKVDYKTYFTVSGLSESNYKLIDEIRLKGVVLQKKEEVKAAAEEAAKAKKVSEVAAARKP